MTAVAFFVPGDGSARKKIIKPPFTQGGRQRGEVGAGSAVRLITLFTPGDGRARREVTRARGSWASEEEKEEE